MTPFVNSISCTELCEILRRAGYPEDVIQEIAARMPDTVVLDHEAQTLERYGVTLDHLTDLMGGSPC
jgi:hypothetical protein